LCDVGIGVSEEDVAICIATLTERSTVHEDLELSVDENRPPSSQPGASAGFGPSIDDVAQVAHATAVAISPTHDLWNANLQTGPTPV
jgi:hypothetical protein